MTVVAGSQQMKNKVSWAHSIKSLYQTFKVQMTISVLSFGE